MTRASAVLAVALACAAFAPRAQAAAPPPAGPPYKITADNMTGGRGPEGDELFLTGVRITRERMVLNARNGRYQRATGMVYLDGNVRLRDSTTTVTCDRASFSENEDLLQLDGNVVITDRDATLRAPSGRYDRRTGQATLVGGVSGTDRRQRLLADLASYDRDSMLVRARGHVQGFDDANRVELDADSVDWHRRTHVAIATGAPVLRSKDDNGRTSELRARLLRVNSETRLAEALDSVTVVSDTMHAGGAYAVFDDSTGHGLLLGHPRAWDNETTITGDTLETWAPKRQLQRFVVRGQALMDYASLREPNRGEASRLTGRRVDVFIHDNRMDSLMATGEARNAYTAPLREGKTAETNVASGDTILVYFKDRKIDHARVQGGAKGEYHAPVALGDTTNAKLEIVRYDGQHIDFVVPKNQIVLDGLAHLTYRDLELNARRVQFDSAKNTLVAEGRPQLLDKGDKVDGQLMSYDLASRTGTIYQATTNYEKGLYHGAEIRKSGDNVLDVLGGSYSTCDLPDPHYHFSARWMKIYLKDKLIAKPVVFYLRNVPVLALPFYVFPIKPGRHSGFLFPSFEFGFNNRSGQFLRNAGYYWAPNDYMDATVAGDYYQGVPQAQGQTLPTWKLSGELNYKLLYEFDGHLEGQFTRDEQQQRDDYLFSGSHSETFGDRTRLSAQANFVSSRNRLPSLTIEQQLNRFLTSQLSLSHSADWASFSALIDRRQDLDADVSLQYPTGTLQAQPVGTLSPQSRLTVSEPSLSVTFPTRTLGSYAGIKDTRAGKWLQTTYFSLSSRFLSLRNDQSFVQDYLHSTRMIVDTVQTIPSVVLDTTFVTDSTAALGVRSTTRRAFSSNVTLTDSRRLFGWLNFAPSVFSNFAVFDFDELGHKVVPAGSWLASLGTGTTLYRTLHTPFTGVSLRHILSPSASLQYAPAFSGLTYTTRDSVGVPHLQHRFNSFGGIDVSGFEISRVSFSLDQRLQAKREHAGAVQRLDNLLGLTTAGNYDLRYREDGLQHPLSPLTNTLRLQPPGLVYGDASSTVDVYNRQPLRTFGYNLGFNLSSRGAQKAQGAALPVERRDAGSVMEDFVENWQVSLAYSYSGGYTTGVWGAQKTANAVFHYAFSPNWVVDYSTAYDVTRRQMLTQRWSLSRRLHCWEAIFTRSFTPGGVAEYYFRLGVRDQREIYYERGSRQQSFGGIQ